MTQPKHICERKIKIKIAKNPQLINSFDRNKNRPLIRRYCHVPFNNKKMYIANTTNDFDNISFSNYTNYDNITSSNVNMILSNCTNNEKNIYRNIPRLLLTIPCGLSFFLL